MNDEMREPMAWVAWNPNGLAWVFGKLPTRAECGCWSGTMGLFGPGGCGAARCPGMDRKGDVAAWAAEPVALYAGTLGAEHEPQEAEAQDDPEPEEAPASPGVLEAAREAIKRVAIYSRVYVDLLDEDGWDSEEGKTMAHALCALRDALAAAPADEYGYSREALEECARAARVMVTAWRNADSEPHPSRRAPVQALMDAVDALSGTPFVGEAEADAD